MAIERVATPVARMRQLLKLLPRDGWTLLANGSLRRRMRLKTYAFDGTPVEHEHPCCPIECAAGGLPLCDAEYALRMPGTFAMHVVAAADARASLLRSRPRAVRKALLAHVGLEGHENA